MFKKPKSALVTGSSTGIGRMYALELARTGVESLIVCARREEKLENVSREAKEIANAKGVKLKVKVVVADLTSPSGLQSIKEAGDSCAIPLDFVVNNAGFGSLRPFVELPINRERNMVKLNCLAPLELSHHFAESMLAGNGGNIINVCSTGAYQPLPYMATYGATKSFLYSFSLAIARELRHSNVRVMAHCPGPTDSDFHIAVGLARKLDFVDAMPTQPVVRSAIEAALKGRVVHINGFRNRLLSAFAKILPGPVSSGIVAHGLRRYKEYIVDDIEQL
jgi:hypothetical protein